MAVIMRIFFDFSGEIANRYLLDSKYWQFEYGEAEALTEKRIEK
jgi:hypothetical protein